MIREKIFNNKWVSLERSTDDNGCQYIYATEPWCNSEGVAVLVYRTKINGWGYTHRQFLGRYEICPAHSEVAELCAITGGCDKEGETPVEVAVREVEEEAGYKVNVKEMTSLGTVKPSKASDKTVHLFAVCVDGLEQGEALGDGTLGEVGAYTEWVDGVECILSKDPVLTVMIGRLALQ